MRCSAMAGKAEIVIKAHNVDVQAERRNTFGHSQEITSVAFSPDGKSVLTGSRDGTLILWLAIDWREPELSEGPAANATAGR